MDYQNLNTLISSRDFARKRWAYTPQPGPGAPKEAWEEYYKIIGSQNETETENKSIFGSVKDAASKAYTGVKDQFTNSNSFLQKMAARGYGDDAEAKAKFENARQNGDPLTKVIRTATGVARAGKGSLEELRNELAGGPYNKRYQKTVGQLAKKGLTVTESGEIHINTSNKTKAILDAEEVRDRLYIENENKRNDMLNLHQENNPEAVSNLRKSWAEVSKAEKKVSKLEKERDNYIRNAEAAKSSAQADLAKAAQKDKETRNQIAFRKGANIVQGTKDVTGSALSLVSSTHAAKEARRIGAGGVQARNARVAYLLGDRSLGTKVMSGHLFKGDNAVSRFVNRKVTRGAVKTVNNRGFSDDLDLLKLREAEAISYMLTKDYTQFEDFSEIARPTVVKTSKIGKEELGNGKVLSDEVDIPYVKEQSMLTDPVDLLEKNYYQASPEEKKFQESLFIGFSEESDGGNYEKTLESLSKIVNPYE